MEAALNKLHQRYEANRATIEALGIAASSETLPENHQAIIKGLQLRLHYCNRRDNNWFSKTLRREDGSIYSGFGQLWRCGSKLCSNCLARQSRISRKQVLKAISCQVLQPDDRFYFMTFTFPHSWSMPLLLCRSIVNRAWRLFTKRSLCRSLFRGGVKSEEFTVGANGFHYHLHVLALCKWLSYQEVRRVWTDCLEQSFLEHEQEFIVDTKDGYAIVHIDLIKAVDKKSVNEVCKYVTKSDSWTKMPSSALAEIALVPRWHRMFELFGTFRTGPIVHTRSLNAASAAIRNTIFGEPEPTISWRDEVQSTELWRFEVKLREMVVTAQSIEWQSLHVRNPHSTFAFPLVTK